MRARLLIPAVLIVTSVVATSDAAARIAHPEGHLRVVGTRLIDGPGRGHAVRLLGINRSGTEYACLQGWGIFDSPHPSRIDDPSMLAAMKRWKINAIRVPLNEDCWLGINASSRWVGASYRSAIARYVAALHRAGLYVILDLHTAAPGSVRSADLERMPDADHAPDFWRSLASRFRPDHKVVFDLYNEPNHVGWDCWRDGCQIPAYDDGYGRQPSYRAAGMQALVDAVRSTGATQPLLVGGIGYAGDVSRWLAHAPHDPRHALVVAQHNYGGFAPCDAGCRRAILRAARHHPVQIGELGENDCAHAYIDRFMAWADRHGIGYLGWTWDATSPGGWDCARGPALIADYAGRPTPFGVGFRNHFRRLARG